MPDHFVIIGAQRCGTTYVTRVLDEHPDIEMAKPFRPEPKFFLEEEQYARGIDHYESRFFADERARVRGEKSTSYIEHEPAIERIAGLDVSHRALERAAERLRLEEMPQRRLERLTLLHGSLTYRDRRLEGFDAAVVIEVIEHLEPSRWLYIRRSGWWLAGAAGAIMTALWNYAMSTLFVWRAR